MFDVEVLQDKNRFRTYRISNIDLQNFGGYVSPKLTSYENSANLSNNIIHSSNKRINPAKQKDTGQSKQVQDTVLAKGDKIQQTQRMTESVKSKKAKDTARTERQSVHKPQPAEFKVGGAKTNVKGIASVQSGKVTVKLKNGDLAIADDLNFESETQGELYDKAKHFNTNAAKTFTAVYKSNIPVNDYFLGFLRIHGAARTGTAFEQTVKLTEYTAMLPSHIQQSAYNAGLRRALLLTMCLCRMRRASGQRQSS